MRVIRTGESNKPEYDPYNAEVLQGCWELETQLGKRANPLEQLPPEIPELVPIPMTDDEIDKATRL